ncbi:DUF2294 domain-containing protein [Planococcus halotolerans]|uniref:DUF2294 domain-containing protein n=1 Tax=Planococcus halotolerans TaxID=2233542 RepID=A0A365KXB7_9BACL|nr:DUF2294 domain-containing protein [Planococcus halotolerans]QHJ72224.1 DUF2294 family protein [Planococcus halotolerans]RAZ77759.1 DUF2294 domain-containing protein [Planococcus halotolerans]
MEHTKWTKGSLEAEISKTLTQWEKDFLGRGSVSVKTDILRDMLVVSLSGVLTPAEYKLCDAKEGLLAVKRMRSDLVESGRDFLGNVIRELTGEEVKSFHTDISTHTGERIMVFRLSGNLQEKLQ